MIEEEIENNIIDPSEVDCGVLNGPGVGSCPLTGFVIIDITERRIRVVSMKTAQHSERLHLNQILVPPIIIFMFNYA